ncbi:ABC transport system periplasmic substrate binding protein [Legionella nautarum]|uniref:ABC transport system periplasmic substrate binding protein n=1 Tax=Legionella nautarum TaxID=45070 RepID=A0A0W0WM36_9GAMM|nr:MlaD family protein [Legionella nautarum]KTD33403.1 ABC transport system periplasmic substrate binding protein [Legionella nautarum]
MEAKTNYTMVGLAVLILAGALVAAGLWLSVGLDQKKYHTYAVFIREAVSGLSEQSPVKYNGVKVGFVSKIELNHHDPRQVEILLNIEEGTPITVSTMATLISQGITGNTYVGLSAESSDLTPLRAAPHQPYPIIPAKPSLFNQLDKVLKEVSVNVNKVSVKISQVFSKDNLDNLNHTLANIRSFSDVLAKNSPNLNHSLKSVEVLLQNSADLSEEFPEIVTDLKSGLKKFNSMATSLTNAGNKVSTTMATGKTAIDKISQQTIPPMITLMRRLDVIAANLEKISKEMRQNPAIVIRGTTPPQPGPGE